MEEKLTASIGVFWINTICTLRCKRCITLTPYHKSPSNFPLQNIQKEIDTFFEIYDQIDHFDIEGGEPLLHPNLYEIIEKAFTYKDRFNRLHILTNGTLLPSEKILEFSSENDVLFILDDYGDLSSEKDELIKLLIKYNIKYRIDKYYGDDQYYGGWVDFGNMEFKHYSEGEVAKIFNSCRQAHCSAPYIKNGKMFICSIQAAGVKHIPLIEEEYVDLFDENKSIQQKRKIAKGFGKKVINSCYYCKSFDAEQGERYSAAEQLPQTICEELKICL